MAKSRKIKKIFKYFGITALILTLIIVGIGAGGYLIVTADAT